MNDDQNIPEKIIPESPNFQTELAAQIADIAPQIVSDGKLDVNKLRELVNGDAETAPERFGLFWPGKQRAQAVAQLPTSATLKPAPEESVDWDTTKNIFIEGDNLEVLKTLQDSYRRKIKMIYIDPPYNTGKEFIYPDNFQEGLQTYLEYTGQKNEAGENTESKKETGGRKHSSWLSMMYPRLQLAKSLLTNDGIIFISIDDNEQANLKSLCDDVFGPENFAGQFVWKTRQAGGKQVASNNVSIEHEYVIAYFRNTENKVNGVERDKSTYTNPDNDPRGDWAKHPLDVGSTRFERPNCFYDLVDPSTGNVFHANPNRVWAFAPASMEKLISEGKVIFDPSGKNRPGLKKFFTELKTEKKPVSTWLAKPNFEIEYNSSGTKEVARLFGDKRYFDYPKPVSLIEILLSQGSEKDSIVLDFFSGSGTTAHAVMALNAKDGGNRQHIQIQLPEPADETTDAYRDGYKTISAISMQRIKLAGEYIMGDLDKSSSRNDQLDTGFRVYKLTSSNFSEWNEMEAAKDPTQAVLDFASNKKIDAEPVDLLTEIMLRSRITLDASVEKKNLTSGGWVYIVDDGRLAAYVDDAQLTVEQATEIAEMSPAKFVALDSAFNGNDALKINIANICRDKHVGEFKTI